MFNGNHGNLVVGRFAGKAPWDGSPITSKRACENQLLAMRHRDYRCAKIPSQLGKPQRTSILSDATYVGRSSGRQSVKFSIRKIRNTVCNPTDSLGCCMRYYRCFDVNASLNACARCLGHTHKRGMLSLAYTPGTIPARRTIFKRHKPLAVVCRRLLRAGPSS